MARQQGLTLEQRPGGAAARGGWVLPTVVAGIGSYLLSPILFSQHLEGYTANLRAIALVWDQGKLADLDGITPIIIQYLFATRSGIILLLDFVDRAFGHPGDAGFRGLVVASFALLALSSTIIAARWGKLGVATCLISFIAIPGLVDIGSFFNDNIISAALGVAALAAVSRSGSLGTCAASGVLLGAAALCRTDALLLCPAIAGMVWLQHRRLTPLLVRGIAGAAGFLLVSVAAFEITGTTLISALHIPAQFVPPRIGIGFRLTIFELFIGIPALALLCVGGALNLPRHLIESFDLRWTLLFLAYPVFILSIAVLRLSTEVRYIYPLLAPFYLVHVGRGLEHLWTLLRGHGWPRRFGIALASALVLVSVVPPDTFVRDGPHATVGRLWMPLLWFRWQASVARSLHRMDELAATAEIEPQLLVLSTHFNEEYFFRLRLLERGFESRSAESEFPGCRGGFSVYAKPGHRTLHLRTENQYGFASVAANVIVRSVQIERALQCPAAWDFNAAYLAFAGMDVRVNTLPLDPMLFHSVLPRLPTASAFSTTFGLRAILPGASPRESPAEALRGEARMGDIQVIPLSKPELESIKASADQIMADFNVDGEPRPFTYEDFKALYRARP